MKNLLSLVVTVVMCATLVLTAGCADTADAVGKNASSNNASSKNASSNNEVSDNTASNNASSVAVENIYGSAELTNNQVAAFQNSGEITLYTDEAQIAQGKHNEALKAELEWYKEYYGLTIKYIYQPSNGNERTNFIIDLGKGKAPDYIPLDYGNRDWIQLASFGTVYSVEDLKEMGVEGLDHPEFEKYKNIKDRFRLDGECYSPVAVSCDPVVVCVNTDLFNQYSVKSPVQYYKEGNWNMDTYIECCKELTRDLGGGTKIWGSFAVDNSWYMVALGTKTVKWKSNNELVYAVEEVETFKNLKIVDNLYSQGYSPVSKLYTQEQPFKAGRMGMYICTATELAQMAPDMTIKWEIIPMPSGSNNTSGLLPGKASGAGVVITTKNAQGVINYLIANRVRNNILRGDDHSLYNVDVYEGVYNKEQIELIKKLSDKIDWDQQDELYETHKMVELFWNDMCGDMTPKETIDTYGATIKASVTRMNKSFKSIEKSKEENKKYTR